MTDRIEWDEPPAKPAASLTDDDKPFALWACGGVVGVWTSAADAKAYGDAHWPGHCTVAAFGCVPANPAAEPVVPSVWQPVIEAVRDIDRYGLCGDGCDAIVRAAMAAVRALDKGGA